MRKLEFVEPNFICEVEDSEGHTYPNWLFHFDSKDKLIEYLESRTYKLVDAQPYDFKTWLDEAETATNLAKQSRNQPDFEYNNKIWTKLKQYLFAISHGKCGYCEQKVTGVYAGDVEHYRPKKKVTEDPAHPGYYWLAYDPSNYVPVCQNCNGARAKANHFPLEPGSPRAYAPEDDIAKERPLLINPLGADDPAIELEFIGPEGGKEDFGKVKGISPAGETSREIYHLNRGELIVARREAYKTLSDDKATLQADWENVTQRLLSTWRSGIKEFTLVIRAFLTVWYKQIQEQEQRTEDEKIKAHEEQIKQAQLRKKALQERIDNDMAMLKTRLPTK